MFYSILRSATIAFIMIAVSASTTYAGEAAKIKWTDLAPKTKPLKNPMFELSDDQLPEFGNIEYWMSLEFPPRGAEARKEYIEAKKMAIPSRKKLLKQGINVDKLFDRYHEWQDELDRRRKLTVSKYNQKLVSLAGYLLPLDFSDKGAKEFLLVPYVGACIHTPSPPANQIAFVRMKKRYKIQGLYDPVWVTGRMSTELVAKDLSFVDGASKVEAGYTLAGDNIKKYVRPKLPPPPEK